VVVVVSTLQKVVLELHRVLVVLVEVEAVLPQPVELVLLELPIQAVALAVEIGRELAGLAVQAL
jgi:hypothetical protein